MFPLAPDKETGLVGHQPTQAAKVALGQLLELKLRALVDFQIEGIDFLDNGRDIVDHGHLDDGSLFGRLEFPSQIPAHLPAQCLVHVVVEIGVVDVEAGVGHARQPGKPVMHQILQWTQVWVVVSLSPTFAGRT
jgi:hypothetical protein